MEDKLRYLAPNKIDPKKIHSAFQKLILFDNAFLNMQAMNVAATDQLIMNWEYSLLHDYIRSDSTPLESVILISALSQMWIFGTYELLRTWRQQIREHLDPKSNKFYANAETDQNLSEAYWLKNREKFKDASFAKKAKNQYDKMEPIFRCIEDIRVNLAKHEAPKSDKFKPRAPGYGRININCGSLDYEIMDRNGNYSFINRRDIADMLRDSISRKKKIL
ncbi:MULTISPECIES: hypothetical protein [unclassified Leptospira]|uniref:hypothetical protein n=1 Tax=unclassified Leptospira TaxID=2633828 RepID=UPI0002BD6B6C|nr:MULTISPECIES: hypothetical protein [unclassified Leptospira]EMJ98761.1 hypothetical protein LEP1GSC192_3646 [Leptospira sp. B5-022]MCR1792528.1 hypothetical protein [Leptospira sp. id769339]